MTETCIVDLGTKRGLSIELFIRFARPYFGPELAYVHPSLHLGIDLDEERREGIEGLGYRFMAGDLTLPETWDKIPEADFFTAWDFLEHMPDLDTAKWVLKQALTRARRGVWIRMPSFEQDDTGELPLRALDLRFAWTRWSGHKTYWLKEDVLDTLAEFKDEEGKAFHAKFMPWLRIDSTGHPDVVPQNAPKNTVKYHPDLGLKPAKTFNPPLIGSWDCLIRPGEK